MSVASAATSTYRLYAWRAGDRAAGDQLTRIHTAIYEFYGQELAYLASRLDGMVEADGTTVLDNTIVLWASEVAAGRTHSWDNMPFVLLGGGQGRIQTQRFHQYDGANHSRLLVTLCQAFGIDVETYGGFDTGGGALPGLLA